MEEALDLSSDRILNERMNDVLCRSAWPFKQLNCGSMTCNARARVCVCVCMCVCVATKGRSLADILFLFNTVSRPST